MTANLTKEQARERKREIIRTFTPVSYTHLDVYKRQKTACKQFVASYQQQTEYLRNELPINIDRKSTRLNSSHIQKSRMPSSA